MSFSMIIGKIVTTNGKGSIFLIKIKGSHEKTLYVVFGH